MCNDQIAAINKTVKEGKNGIVTKCHDLKIITFADKICFIGYPTIERTKGILEKVSNKAKKTSFYIRPGQEAPPTFIFREVENK